MPDHPPPAVGTYWTSRRTKGVLVVVTSVIHGEVVYKYLLHPDGAVAGTEDFSRAFLFHESWWPHTPSREMS